MRILILGVTGMLGHKLFLTLRDRFPGTVGTVMENMDAEPWRGIPWVQGPDVIRGTDAGDPVRLKSALAEWRPDYIVNCIGIIKQRPSATDALHSIALNSLLPHQLAAWAAEWGGRVIHFSTDCVFKGDRGRYTEDDPSDADDLYGRSKSLGEVATSNALTLRTSIIGRELAHHRSLLDWVLSQDGCMVRGFTRVIYSGITTNQMADVVTLVIREFPTLSGLYQVVSSPISKHDLLDLIRDAYGLRMQIEPEIATVSDRSMLGEKFRAATGYTAPAWPDLVAQLVADPTPYAEWGVTVPGFRGLVGGGRA